MVIECNEMMIDRSKCLRLNLKALLLQFTLVYGIISRFSALILAGTTSLRFSSHNVTTDKSSR